MGKRFTIADVLKSSAGSLNQHLIPLAPVKKKNKFGATKKEVDGVVFHSIGEAKRYVELCLLRKAGIIGLLELQVRYELNPGGAFSFVYVADFRYRYLSTGMLVVEDWKGHRTREYLKKKKLMKKIHGIEIFETNGKKK